MIVYILIFEAFLELHQVHVKKVLPILRLHELYVKSEKCKFVKQTIQSLVISTNRIAVDLQKVRALLHYPVPDYKKGIQRFVVFANIYHRFIKAFSAITAPITQIAHQYVCFSLSPESQGPSTNLKLCLPQL